MTNYFTKQRGTTLLRHTEQKNKKNKKNRTGADPALLPVFRGGGYVPERGGVRGGITPCQSLPLI